MSQPKKSSDIGLGKVALLCNMSTDERIRFIAEGSPILFQSARSPVEASLKLAEHPREAEILAAQAEEESAKVLILVDLMRCPRGLVSARAGFMTRWFYDHLARLIYAEAQMWRPVIAAELQSYIDSQRKSHYLEGEYGEYIMPNWALFRRESTLYADAATDENGHLQWISAKSKFHWKTFWPNRTLSIIRISSMPRRILRLEQEGRPKRAKAREDARRTQDVKG